MKTEKLYEVDAYISSFEAAVISSEKDKRGYKTVLSRTAFFPESGGQPSDTGSISGVEVFDVQIENGEIVHYTALPLTAGEAVCCEIDFERRFVFMQNHTAEHIVSGLVFAEYGFDNIGFHLNESEVTFDFNGFFTAEQLAKLELEANRRVWRDLGVKTYRPGALELKKINYRAKDGIEGDVRIVEIEDTDVCACCAPHVKSTGEIGIIKFLGTEKQHGGTRIIMKCGGFALLDYGAKTESIKTICDALSAKPGDAATAFLSLADRYDEARREVKLLKEKLIEYRISAFDPACDAIILTDADTKDLQTAADGLHKTYGGVRTALSVIPGGAAFVMCGAADELEKRFADLRAGFNVKGGGRGEVRQGGIMAPLEKIKEFFKIREDL